MLLMKISKKKKLPKQWKILAETYLTYAPLASFVTPSTKDHEVRDRLAHTTDDVVKKARCACTHDVNSRWRRKCRRTMKNKLPQYHRMPKIRMPSPNVERNYFFSFWFGYACFAYRCFKPVRDKWIIKVVSFLSRVLLQNRNSI